MVIHHIVAVSDGGSGTSDNSVVLCTSCHKDAPHDPFLFANLFLRFSSPKEMIQHYKSNSEAEALQIWRIEEGYYGEVYFRTHSQLVKEKMRIKAIKGSYLGFNHPYGYDYKNNKLIINENEAEIVKIIYSNYIDGNSMGEIAKHLNKINSPTKRGGKWDKRTVANILKNPLYCGEIKWDGIISAASHKAIIDKKIFKTVQELISKRRRRF